MVTNKAQESVNNEFSDILAEFEAESGEELTENFVALVRQSENHDLHGLREGVLKNSYLLSAESARAYKALVLESADEGRFRFKVGLVQAKSDVLVQTKTSISRLLKVYSASAVKFIYLEPHYFEILFNEAYSNKALEKKHEAETKTRNKRTFQWDGRATEVDDDSQKGKSLEDLAGQRLDITDLNEYERIFVELDRGRLRESEMNVDEFVRFVFQDCIKSKASDLHINSSSEFGGVIRYRIQGEMFTRWEGIPLARTAQIIHSICILGNKNHSDMYREIVETTVKLRSLVGGEKKNIEFRFESIYSSPLPSVVLRIQDKPIREINKLGFYSDQIEKLRHICEMDRGIVLVTGATGSGKTNTLESLMAILEDGYKYNIIECGDPIEIEAPRRLQTTIKRTATEKKTDAVYEEAFKATMRLDPDIIYFTELRNSNVAMLALHASVTGHQVFTTLHASDTEETLTRLFTMGLPRDMVAKGVVAVVAQTLIRRLCDFCKVEDRTASVIAGKPIFKENEAGCQHCDEGFAGRSAVAEVFVFNDAIRSWIIEGKKPSEIVELAREQGFYQPMKKIALRKVLDGLTSEFEVSKLVDFKSVFNLNEDAYEGEIQADDNVHSFFTNEIIDADYTDIKEFSE